MLFIVFIYYFLYISFIFYILFYFYILFCLYVLFIVLYIILFLYFVLFIYIIYFIYIIDLNDNYWPQALVYMAYQLFELFSQLFSFYYREYACARARVLLCACARVRMCARIYIMYKKNFICIILFF